MNQNLTMKHVIMIHHGIPAANKRAGYRIFVTSHDADERWTDSKSEQ